MLHHLPSDILSSKGNTIKMTSRLTQLYTILRIVLFVCPISLTTCSIYSTELGNSHKVHLDVVVKSLKGYEDIKPIVQFKSRTMNKIYIQSARKSDGTYKVAGNFKEGLYELRISHPLCYAVTMPVYVNSTITSNVNVRLKPYELRDTSVTFIYGSTSDSLNKKTKATKNSKGEWVAEVPVVESLVYYQVKGDEISVGGRTHTPSKYDSLTVDSEGDCVGILNVKNGKAELLYKLISFPNDELASMAHLSVSDTYLSKILSATMLLDSITENLKKIRNESNLDKWVAESYQALQMVTNKIDSESNHVVKTILYKGYAEFAGIGFYMKKPGFEQSRLVEVDKMLRILPEIWTIGFHSALPVFTLIVDSTIDYSQHVNSLLTNNAIDKDYKSKMLFNIIEVLGLKKHTQTADFYSTIMNEKYQGTNGYNSLHWLQTKQKTEQGLLSKKVQSIIALNEQSKIIETIPVMKEGEYLLIDFWATWCKPCIEGHDELKGALKEYSAKGLRIIGLSLDKDPKIVAKYSSTRHVPWTNYTLPEATKSEILKQYNAESIPQLLLLNSSGTIISCGDQLRRPSLDTTLSLFLN